jgi:hypothetical protein
LGVDLKRGVEIGMVRPFGARKSSVPPRTNVPRANHTPVSQSLRATRGDCRASASLLIHPFFGDSGAPGSGHSEHTGPRHRGRQLDDPAQGTRTDAR